MEKESFFQDENSKLVEYIKCLTTQIREYLKLMFGTEDTKEIDPNSKEFYMDLELMQTEFLIQENQKVSPPVGKTRNESQGKNETLHSTATPLH